MAAVQVHSQSAAVGAAAGSTLAATEMTPAAATAVAAATPEQIAQLADRAAADVRRCAAADWDI